MKLILILTIFYFSGIYSQPESTESVFYCNPTASDRLPITKIENLKTDYNYLISDSLLIDGSIKTPTNIDKLRLIIGEPDTIIKYTDNDELPESPYAIIEYKSMQFRLFRDGTTFLSQLTLQGSNHFIAYRQLVLNKNTLIADLKKIFPKSYDSRDTLSIEGRQLIAMRFFTDRHPTDTQWILLFEQDKLKFIRYFDGND